MPHIDGQRLREERKAQARKASAFVKKLEEMAGTPWSVKHLWNVEGGALCSEEFLIACADALGIDPAELRLDESEQVPA